MNSPVRIWRNHKKVSAKLNLVGRVLTWTKIFAAPAGYEEEAPYFCAIVELENKDKITTQVVDCQSLAIGDKVKTVLRRIGKPGKDKVIEYGIKAVKLR